MFYQFSGANMLVAQLLGTLATIYTPSRLPTLFEPGSIHQEKKQRMVKWWCEAQWF